MKVRFVALAIAAFALWLVPSSSLAQGNSGKTRLTICHVPPGNPDARRTLTVSESAWGTHQSHGDAMGPCGGYGEQYDEGHGADTKRAKAARKKKGKEERRGGSDGDAAGDEIEADDRGGEREEIDEGESGPGGEAFDPAAERAEREQRRAERRESRPRDPSDGQATGDRDEIDEAESGPGGEAFDPAAERAEREQRRAARRESGPRESPDVQTTDDPGEEKRGFFRGMRQFFGFGGDDGEE